MVQVTAEFFLRHPFVDVNVNVEHSFHPCDLLHRSWFRGLSPILYIVTISPFQHIVRRPAQIDPSPLDGAHGVGLCCQTGGPFGLPGDAHANHRWPRTSVDSRRQDKFVMTDAT